MIRYTSRKNTPALAYFLTRKMLALVNLVIRAGANHSPPFLLAIFAIATILNNGLIHSNELHCTSENRNETLKLTKTPRTFGTSLGSRAS